VGISVSIPSIISSAELGIDKAIYIHSSCFITES
jgi:hypothetical protein